MNPAAEEALPGIPRNLRMLLEYDGRAYAGWERQRNGLAVQEVLESAIERITGEKVILNGSGRTDAGVHALGQVASFTLEHRIERSDLLRALNAVLPGDVAVLALDEVTLFFHARFSARSKEYRYRILNDRIGAPLLRHTYHPVFARLDVSRMEATLDRFVGRHDFSAFCREPERLTDRVRTIHQAELRRQGRFLDLHFVGDGFLWNMVRILAGTTVYAGLGKIEPDMVPEIIAARDRKMAGPTLPASGLSLVGVFYGDEWAGSDGCEAFRGGSSPGF